MRNTVSKDDQEEERETILLVLGRQLLEGRKLHEGDREFGKWCNTNFPNLGEHVSKENFGKWCNNNFPNLLEAVNNVEVTAIIWAAEFPEQRAMTATALANMTDGGGGNQYTKMDRTNSSSAKSNKDSAGKLNVGTTAVKVAKAIKRDAPDLADEVSKGNMTLNAADNQRDARENSTEHKKSNKEAADQMNVSDYSVKTAKAIKRDAPDLADEVYRLSPAK